MNDDFYSNINEYYDFIFKTNKAQVDFVKSFTPSNGNVIDIGCGTGSLAIELSMEMQVVVGVDFDSKMIKRANEKRDGNNVSFRQMDMLKVADHYSDFNTISCFGNTLAHLTSLKKINDFCNVAHSTLAKGGSLLIQIVNFDKVLANNISSLPLIDNEKIRFERYYKLDTASGLIEFDTRLTSKNKEEQLDNSIKLYPLKKEELENILINLGFTEIEFFSNFKKDSWSLDGMPTIVKCVK